ncbi:MAG: PPOX class F420-dependent oxidoreductase [Anaerolineae bacterium]|nr:PPOX class F420-dependent oxidoreductase [Anaerolineae bacterium]
MSAVVTNTFASLEGEQYIRLTTFRKSGKAVPTPVWFAESGGKLYVLTLATSGKVKRLRHTPQVELAASDARGNPHGETILAQATIHSADSEMGKFANRTLTRKYGLMKRLFSLAQRMRGTTPVYLEISPRG